MQRLILIIVAFFLLAAVSESANKPGLQGEGTLIPGNTVIVGTTPTDLKDGGPPGQNKQIQIGDTVGGATPNSCLTVDTQGKLAQVSCLLAH